MKHLFALACISALAVPAVAQPTSWQLDPRLGVLRMGEVALASVDAERYSAIGKRLKEQSPMANTFMVTLANGMANSRRRVVWSLYVPGIELAFKAGLR